MINENTGAETVVATSPETAAPVETANAEGAKPENAETAKPEPRKQDNAYHYQKRQNAKLKSELAEMRAQLESITKQQQPKNETKDQGPKESDFETYGDFLEARAAWRAEKLLDERLSQRDKDTRQTQEQMQRQSWMQEREVALTQKMQDFAKSTPDFAEVVEQFGDVADELPDEIAEIFMAMDNAPQAFYNLAKSGQFEQLARLPVHVAAAVIAQAGFQPVTAPEAKQSKAPKPMTPASGAGVVQRNLDQMSPREIVDRMVYNKKK